MHAGYRENLRKLYRELSAASHPSHLDFPTTEQMIKRLTTLEVAINCEELNKVIDLTKRTYDAIFFLVLESIKSMKEIVKTKADVKEAIEKYNLTLLRKYT